MQIAILTIGGLSILWLLGYGIILVREEVLERKLYNMLETKLEINEYLQTIDELLRKTKDKRKVARFNLYKANALYYKGERQLAIACLQEVKKGFELLQKGDEIEKIYIKVLFKVMLDMPYSEKTEQIMLENQKTIEIMKKDRNYAIDIYLILAVYEYKKGNLEQGLEQLKKVKKMNLSRINQIMVRYYLTLLYADLNRMEECETEIEQIEDLRRKSRRELFIYNELENLVKIKRSEVVTISGIDKDVEESQRKEALEKVNQEIENEILKEAEKLKNQVTDMLDEEAKVAAQNVDKNK